MTASRTKNGPSSAPLQRIMSSRPPPLAYVAVLSLGAAMAPFLLSMDSSISSLYLGRRSLSNGSLYSLKNSESFSQLQGLQDVDTSIENRARSNDDADKCSRIFLYLPDLFAEHGHGSQINTYIMGVTASTYLDRAMVLVEPPLDRSKYAGGSQFGCPIDAFHESVTKTSLRKETEWTVKDDFPMGYSRLVEQPAWLSHGCEIPCADSMEYKDWLSLYQRYNKSTKSFEELTCTNPDGTVVNVVATGGGKMRQWYRDNEAALTRSSHSDQLAVWAKNLGATPREAKRFSNMKDARKLWDYVLGLMNKAGFLRLQPWIARDVELFLRTFDIPLNREYSAIHVRRGDKLAVEARGLVVNYWRERGHTDPDNLPSDYVPFAHYLSQWDGPDSCSRDEDGKVLEVKKQNVYIATDDPVVVRGEIMALPNHVNKNTVLWNDCHELTFFFNPTDESSFHLNGDGEEGFEEEGVEDSCFMRYHRNIASIADMMILSKAKTFIGEYNSNWGRVIRTMRVRLNTPAAQSDGDGDDAGDNNDAAEPRKMVQGGDRYTKTLDTRIAWGSTRERAPGY